MLARAVLALALALPARAGAPEDLALAADASADEATRMAAFDRLVALGATDMGHVLAVAGSADADARQRWVAVRALGRIGGARAREALVGLLADDMPAMRAAAAQALGDLGDRTVTGRLTPLLDDPAILVRASAAEALGKLRDPSAVPALDRALASRDNYYRGSSLWVRRHFVAALGAIGDEAAVPALLRCLDDADEAVSAEAVRAFEKVAGFSYADGRDLDEQKAAWRRWAAARLR